ncbi:MAG: SDR family NAD(P)-dependent oxidoreductase [Myxococcales bacterium]|nr:SDR family NAD(P)-dependent oxidoreductase [Myxococcales bacterium]
MSSGLRGKVVLVTGAGNGIGREHALAFAREGAHVVVNDLGAGRDGSGADGGPAQRVVDEIVALGGQALANLDSVTVAEGCQRMVDAALDRWGRLDVVVNNAGILRDKSFVKMTEAEWDLVIEIHLKGSYHVCKAAIPALARQGGSIVNTTSVSGMIGNYGQSNYAAAKAGIYGLTRVLAMELKKANINVNAIAPIAKTRMTEDIDRVGADLSAAHISPIVVFLASDAARNVTGTIVGVAGQRLHLYEVHMNEGVEKPGDAPWTLAEIGAAWPTITAFDTAVAAPSAAAGPDRVAEAFSHVPLAFRPEKAGDWRARLHFAIKDGSSHTLVVLNGTCRVEAGLTGSPDCVLKSDTETIVGIFNQTIAPDKAFMKGRITADNMGVLMKFAMYFDFSARPDPGVTPAAVAADAPPTGAKVWPIKKRWEDGAKFAEPRFAAMYADCTDDRSPAYAGSDAILPPMFHVRLFHGLMFKIATDPELELDLLRLVHGEHDATFHRPLRPWDLVQLRAELESVEEKTGGTVVVSRLFGFVDGQLAVEAKTTYFIRGPKRPGDAPKATPAPEPDRGPPAFVAQAPVGDDLSIRYAEPSLDDNPIHIDPATARAAGHKDLILQGLCTMAMTGAAALRAVGEGDARRLRRLAVRFARPVPNGTSLHVAGWGIAPGVYSLQTRDGDGNLVISNATLELR